MVLMCAGGIVFGTVLGLVHIRWKRNRLRFENEGHTATCFEAFVGSKAMPGAPKYQPLGTGDTGDSSDEDDVILGWGAGVMQEHDHISGRSAVGVALGGAGDGQSETHSDAGSHVHPIYDDDNDILLTVNPTFSKQPAVDWGQRHVQAHALHPPQRSITPPLHAYTTFPIGTNFETEDFDESGGVYA